MKKLVIFSKNSHIKNLITYLILVYIKDNIDYNINL